MTRTFLEGHDYYYCLDYFYLTLSKGITVVKTHVRVVRRCQGLSTRHECFFQVQRSRTVDRSGSPRRGFSSPQLNLREHLVTPSCDGKKYHGQTYETVIGQRFALVDVHPGRVAQ